MKSQKGIIHLGLILIILVFGIGALGYVAYKTNSLPTITASSPTPETTMKDATGEWKTYTNSKNSYKVSYPPNSDLSETDLDAVTINYCGKWDFEACHETSFVPQYFTIQIFNFNRENLVPECLLNSKRIETLNRIEWTTYEGELTGDCTDQGFGGYFYRKSFTLFNNKYIEISYDYRDDEGKNVLSQILSTFEFMDNSPVSTCKPRPACLDQDPRCMIPETADMCPPAN